MIPRIALTARSTNENAPFKIAVLELDNDFMKLLSQLAADAITAHEAYRAIRELQYTSPKVIQLHGPDLSEWVTHTTGVWGSNWHSELVSQGATLMPLQYAYTRAVWSQDTSNCRLIVSIAELQDPQINWRFYSEASEEFFTQPLPLSKYKFFSKLQMEDTTFKREHVLTRSNRETTGPDSPPRQTVLCTG